ncbi:hypothetical protein Tco_1292371 [Tanacetum coccineum]
MSTAWLVATTPNPTARGPEQCAVGFSRAVEWRQPLAPSCWYWICVELGVLHFSLNDEKCGDDEKLEGIQQDELYNKVATSMKKQSLRAAGRTVKGTLFPAKIRIRVIMAATVEVEEEEEEECELLKLLGNLAWAHLQMDKYKTMEELYCYLCDLSLLPPRMVAEKGLSEQVQWATCVAVESKKKQRWIS